jgi:hypothetical protein
MSFERKKNDHPELTYPPEFHRTRPPGTVGLSAAVQRWLVLADKGLQAGMELIDQLTGERTRVRSIPHTALSSKLLSNHYCQYDERWQAKKCRDVEEDVTGHIVTQGCDRSIKLICPGSVRVSVLSKQRDTRLVVSRASEHQFWNSNSRIQYLIRQLTAILSFGYYGLA